MVLSFKIVALVLYLVFIFSAEGVSELSKKISVGIGILVTINIIFNIL